MERKEWNEEKIKAELLSMINEKQLARMPTLSEVIAHFGDSRLSNAISKRKLWYKLADEFNLPIKDSETTLGKSYEDKAEIELIIRGYEVRRMRQNYPYDILVNDSVKIDVKASHLYKGKNGNFYSFNLEKEFATCDVYILFLIKHPGLIEKTLIIPSTIVSTQSQISIGEIRSKYFKYEDRWDLLEKYAEFAEFVTTS